MLLCTPADEVLTIDTRQPQPAASKVENLKTRSCPELQVAAREAPQHAKVSFFLLVAAGYF